MFEMHLISGINNEPPPPPAKLNVKTGPNVACILVFTILLVSADCCFFAFFAVFSGDLGIFV